MTETKSMADKTVLITGAGSGIGRATALAFAREGAAIAVVDVRSDRAAETIEILKGYSVQAHAITCDVGDPNAVKAMFAEMVRQFSRIDFAFNNAGVSPPYKDTAELDDEAWHRVMRINLDGVWHCMREELRHMAANGTGAIVNTSSIAGLRALKGMACYVASKHAVVGLTQTAALDYAERGIRVNAVCPGGVATNMVDEMYKASGIEGEQKTVALKAAAAGHPMQRVGKAEEIAEAVVFLCSERASFITGHCLSVDGGWAAR